VPAAVASRLPFDQRLSVHVAVARAGIEKVAWVGVRVGCTAAKAGAAAHKVMSATAPTTAANTR
jgi:hypothetical protein